MTVLRLTLCGALLLWLAGCASTPSGGDNYKNGGSPLANNVDLSSIPPAVPHPEPISKYGNPDSYTVFGKTYYPLSSARGFTQTGVASWYGRDFHGKRTSSGEPYDMYRMTAAHKTLPLPTYVRVTNLDNGRQTIVRVNDRGPFHGHRIIDLSYVAALKLGIVRNGSARVRIATVTAADANPNSQPRRARPRVTPVADRSAPTARATPAVARPSPTVDAASPAVGGYLQVGAFARAANARKLRRRLQAMGMTRIEIQPPRDANNALYRVRAGPFDSIHARQTTRSRIMSMGLPTIVIDP